MRQYRIDAFGIADLKVVDADVPRPGPGQALVRMTAASLNYRDLLVIAGRYDPRMRLPLVPVSDGVGEVVEVGPDVRRVRVGDRVAPIHVPGWIAGGSTEDAGPRGGPSPGVLAEYVAFDARDLVVVPEHLTDEEAATLPCAGVTAWNALHGLSSTKPGDRVLVLGTGGVALFALQFAKLAGAEVAITSSSAHKLERARALGADHLIDYAAEPEWWRAVKRVFPDGADKVIELGGAKTLAQSLRSVRRCGEISLIGSVTGGVPTDFNLIPAFMRAVRLQGVAVGPREVFEDMVRAIAFHRVRPVVDQSFGFEDVSAALARLASGHAFGKITVRIDA